MKVKNCLILLTLTALTTNPVWSNPLTPSELLNVVYSKNLEISSMEARAEAESAAISSKYSLSNPRVGLMREQNTTFTQPEMNPMDSWSVSQEVMFPIKYFAMGSAQRARAKAAKQDYLDKKLEVRQKALTAYYGYYTAHKILSLLEAQKETLREITRITEARRATGAVPQQDELKIHVEQTKLENELLLQKQEIVDLQAELNAILNRDPNEVLSLPKEELRPPKLTTSIVGNIQKIALEQSKSIASSLYMLNEAKQERRLTRLNYFPDFMFSYKKPFSRNAPANAYSLSIEMTIPLWFFSRQLSENSAASARVIEAEKRLEQVKRNTGRDVKSIGTKVNTFLKLLDIYETALIPQATTTLRSSTAAYSTGRIVFQELLDSERSLYSIRIDYYRTLAKCVEAVAILEKVVGDSVSDLPFEGDKL